MPSFSTQTLHDATMQAILRLTCCFRISPSRPAPPCFCSALILLRRTSLSALVSATRSSSCWFTRWVAASSVVFRERECRSEMRLTLSLYVRMSSWMEEICNAARHEHHAIYALEKPRVQLGCHEDYCERGMNRKERRTYLAIERGHGIRSASEVRRTGDCRVLVPWSVILLGVWVRARTRTVVVGALHRVRIAEIIMQHMSPSQCLLHGPQEER